MLKRLLGYFSHDLSIDLGTANTLIYLAGQGTESHTGQDESSQRDRAANQSSVAYHCLLLSRIVRIGQHLIGVSPEK